MGRSKVRLVWGAAVLLAGSACGSDGLSPDAAGTTGTQGVDGGTGGGASGGTGGTGLGVTATSGGLQPGVDGGLQPSTGGSNQDIVDPTGVWWTEVEAVGKQDLPTVGLLEDSIISFVMRVEIAGTVPNQTATFQFCKLQTAWVNPLLAEDVHIIGFRPEATAAFDETLSVDFSGLSVGSEVPVPPLKFVGGGDATGAVIDEDGDGHPAITTFVRIILPFEVAEIITIDANLDVKATDENTLTGTLGFDVGADIIDSNNALFVPPGYFVSITPDSNAIPLTVRRLPGGGDCSAIPSTIEFADIPEPLGPPNDLVLGPQPAP